VKLTPAILVAALLAGCATLSPAATRPQPAGVHHHVRKIAKAPVPVAVPAPPATVEAPQVAPAPPKPPTFAERFRETFAKIKWLH
jgi:hypothetical protein